MEFRQHKRDYYVHKLGYAQVNEDTLRDQAEGYARWETCIHSFRPWCFPGTLFYLPVLILYFSSRDILLLPGSVADPGWLSRIRIFSIPYPGSASKNLSILTQKIVYKLSAIWPRVFIPNPDPGSGSWFTHHGSRGQKGTGSRISDPDPQHPAGYHRIHVSGYRKQSSCWAEDGVPGGNQIWSCRSAARHTNRWATQHTLCRSQTLFTGMDLCQNVKYRYEFSLYFVCSWELLWCVFKLLFTSIVL